MYMINKRYKKIIAISLLMMTSNVANISAGQSKKLKTKQDSISYALGYIVGGQQLGSFMVNKYGCDKELFLKAVADALYGDSATMGQQSATRLMNEADKIKREEEDKEKNINYEKQKAINNKYLDENIKKSGFAEIENSWNKQDRGIQRRIITQGTGEIPTTSSVVKFNYSYKLTDGTLVSKSDGDYPAESVVSTLLPGLQDALTHMKVGSKWEVVIPSELGFDKEEQYKDNGKILVPANSILIFELELLNCGAPEGFE